MTGGYFNKLLQFLEPSCIALASLVTANGACVAGCGLREAVELAGGLGVGGGGPSGLGVLLPAAAGPGEEGVAAPWAPGPCPGSAAGMDTFRALFLLFLFIAPQARVYGQGGKLPLAPVRSINKKRNRTRKRV